jgi:hypothetical protein
MKNVDRLVEVADLDPVAYFEEDLVLYINIEDENNPSTLCVQANFETRQFGPVQPLGVFLESKPYLPIYDVDARISQRQRLLDEISPDAIDDMLRDYNQKKRFIQKNMVLLCDQYPGWQPGG